MVVGLGLKPGAKNMVVSWSPKAHNSWYWAEE